MKIKKHKKLPKFKYLRVKKGQTTTRALGIRYQLAICITALTLILAITSEGKVAGLFAFVSFAFAGDIILSILFFNNIIAKLIKVRPGKFLLVGLALGFIAGPSLLYIKERQKNKQLALTNTNKNEPVTYDQKTEPENTVPPQSKPTEKNSSPPVQKTAEKTPPNNPPTKDICSALSSNYLQSTGKVKEPDSYNVLYAIGTPEYDTVVAEYNAKATSYNDAQEAIYQAYISNFTGNGCSNPWHPFYVKLPTY